MKNYLMSILKYTCLILILGCSHALQAEDGIHKFEKLWQEKGLQKFLTAKQTEFSFSSNEMNAFVYSKREFLRASISNFWKQAALDSSMENLKEVENNLISVKTELESNMKDFSKQKKENSLGYKDIISVWEVALAAPSPPSPPSPPTPCQNVDFEMNNFTNWQVWLGDACYYEKTLSCNSFTIDTYSNSNTQGYLELVSTPGFDTYVGGSKLSMIAPGGAVSLRLENKLNGGHATKVALDFYVSSTNPIYAYKYALVLEEPDGGHAKEEKPYFRVILHDNNTNEDIECATYTVVADPDDIEFGSSKFQNIEPGSSVKFLDWTTRVVDLQDRIGHSITANFVVSDCALGGHLGYAYIDGACLSDNITIGGCLPDGTRQLSVTGTFPSYKWSGPGIVGTNSGTSIFVNRAGVYRVYKFTDRDRCKSQAKVTVDTCPPGPTPDSCILNVTSHTIGSCNSATNLFNLDMTITLTAPPSKGLIKIQDGKIEQFLLLPVSSPFNFQLVNLLADGKTHEIVISLYPDRFISDERALCTYTLSITAPEACFTPEMTAPCENCIGSFMPIVGETYVLSAWVKEDVSPPTPSTYANAYIQIQYSGASNPGPATPSGDIIEGWQRIYFEFTVPSGAASITVQLGTSTDTAYFDDIRIYPLKASMKSYVYDPISLKLVAVLDENNYATFYEYDQEGALIRTKKETERGVVTISENRQNNPKK